MDQAAHQPSALIQFFYFKKYTVSCKRAARGSLQRPSSHPQASGQSRARFIRLQSDQRIGHGAPRSSHEQSNDILGPFKSPPSGRSPQKSLCEEGPLKGDMRGCPGQGEAEGRGVRMTEGVCARV